MHVKYLESAHTEYSISRIYDDDNNDGDGDNDNSKKEEEGEF